jgi:cytoskeletal protein RodZ
MILKEVAKYLGMDHRELLNKLKDLDTQIKKNEKTEVKKAKYGK